MARLTLKLAFCTIFVCSFVKIIETNSFQRMQVLHRSLSELVRRYTNPKVVIREIPIEDDHHEQILSIDLTKPRDHTIAYYKHAMLLYCQILDHKFFLKPELLNNLRNRLEQFDDNPPANAEIEVTKQLGKLFEEILLKYNVLIEPKNYLEKAYYYDALQWIKANLVGMEYKYISDLIDFIINIKIKAVNYLHQIIRLSRRGDYFDYTREKLKTLNGWFVQDDYTLALYFIEQMVVSEGKDAVDVSLDCANIKIYEQILDDTEPVYLSNTLKTDPWKMLQIIDYSFHLKSKQDSNIKSPYTEAKPTTEIDLSNFKRGTVEFYKYVVILFVEAFEKRFEVENLISAETRHDLIWYPISYDPYTSLRYCTFAKWAENLMREMSKEFQEKKELKRFLDKAYLHRIITWLENQFKHDNLEEVKCRHLIFYYLRGLLYKSSSQHILYDMVPSDVGTGIFHIDVNRETTLEKLLQLGKVQDDAVNTMLMLTADQLIADSESADKQASDLRDIPNRDDEIKKQISKCEEVARNAKNKWKSVSSYGDPEIKILCRDMQVYEDLMNEIEDSDCEFTLFHKKQELLDKIKAVLNNPLYNSDNLGLPQSEDSTHDTNNNGAIVEIHGNDNARTTIHIENVQQQERPEPATSQDQQQQQGQQSQGLEPATSQNQQQPPPPEPATSQDQQQQRPQEPAASQDQQQLPPSPPKPAVPQSQQIVLEPAATHKIVMYNSNIPEVPQSEDSTHNTNNNNGATFAVHDDSGVSLRRLGKGRIWDNAHTSIPIEIEEQQPTASHSHWDEVD